MLEIIDDAIELCRRLKPYIQQIAESDPTLAKQLRDSSKSIAQNLAEGSGCTGGRKKNHYRIALGSARESYVSIRLAEADELIEGLDAVSLGPEIRDPHSPDERVKVSSVAKFYRFLTALLAEIADG